MKETVVISSTIHRSSTVIITTITTYIALIIAAIILPPHIWIASLSAVGTVICLYYAPWRIDISDKELIIRRTFTPKRIQIESITTINLCKTESPEIRIAGDGGLFGYMGWYRNQKLGIYFRYMGSTKNTFYIELSNRRRYMISCDNPEEIIAAVRKCQGVSKHILKHT